MTNDRNDEASSQLEKPLQKVTKVTKGFLGRLVVLKLVICRGSRTGVSQKRHYISALSAPAVRHLAREDFRSRHWLSFVSFVTFCSDSRIKSCHFALDSITGVTPGKRVVAGVVDPGKDNATKQQLLSEKEDSGIQPT
jgi:hypothetical protein